MLNVPQQYDLGEKRVNDVLVIPKVQTLPILKESQKHAVEVSSFLANTPVIADLRDANQAKTLRDGAKGFLKGIAEAQKEAASPFYSMYKNIMAFFAPDVERLCHAVEELDRRLSAFLIAEEARRKAAAQEALRIATDAVKAAIEARDAERDARENVDLGEIGVDVLAIQQQTDAAADAARSAEIQAAIAKRDAERVRIGGGIGRAVGLRKKETLVVENWINALNDICATLNQTYLPVEIEESIITASRAFRKTFGRLPAGVVSKIERTL